MPLFRSDQKSFLALLFIEPFKDPVGNVKPVACGQLLELQRINFNTYLRNDRGLK